MPALPSVPLPLSESLSLPTAPPEVFCGALTGFLSELPAVPAVLVTLGVLPEGTGTFSSTAVSVAADTEPLSAPPEVSTLPAFSEPPSSVVSSMSELSVLSEPSAPASSREFSALSSPDGSELSSMPLTPSELSPAPTGFNISELAQPVSSAPARITARSLLPIFMVNLPA